MESIKILELGQGGLNRDDPPFTLSGGTWNTVRNVNMRNRMISSAAGFVERPRCNEEMIVRHLLPFPVVNRYFWNQAGTVQGVGTVCLSDGLSSRVVTPAAGISIQEGDQWTGGVLNGVPLLNNGSVNPPFYLPSPDVDGIWTPLPFSPGESWADKAIAADVIRPFKNYIFALGIHRAAGYYPHLVMWSDAADPDTVPFWQDWTTLDPTILAGEQLLAETSGYLVDAVPLHDLLMVYKEDSIWSASLVQSNQVFRFRQAIPTIGAFSPNCIGVFKHGHAVLGDGDVIHHNGTTAQSIVADRIRRHLFRTMDSTNYRNSFLVVDHENQEILVCYPENGATYPTIMVVWNWRHNTWTIRDLPDQTFWITSGVDNFGLGLATDAWGSDPGEDDIFGNPTDPGSPNYDVPYAPAVWGDAAGSPPPPYFKPWGARSFNPTLQALVGSFEAGNINYRVRDFFTNTNGTRIENHLTQEGLPWFVPPAVIGQMTIQANRLQPTAGFTGIQRCWTDLESTDIQVAADITYEGVGGGVFAGFTPTDGRDPQVQFDVLPPSNQLRLTYGPGTVVTAPVPSPPVSGQPIRLEIEIDGTSLVANADGQEIFNIHDGLIEPIAYGVGIQFEDSPGTITADNFFVDPVYPVGGLYRIDSDFTTWFDSPVSLNRIERQGIPLFDTDQFFVVNRMYPIMEATGPVDFFVGSQEHANDKVTWTGPFSFNPNTEQFIDPLLEANLLAIRVEMTSGGAFKLYGIKADVTPSTELHHATI